MGCVQLSSHSRIMTSTRLNAYALPLPRTARYASYRAYQVHVNGRPVGGDELYSLNLISYEGRYREGAGTAHARVAVTPALAPDNIGGALMGWKAV